MQQLTPLQILLMSGYNIVGLGLGVIPNVPKITRPPFNVVMSNVPGVREDRYFNGAHLDATFPASIALDNVGMNLTVVTYARSIDFGVTACRTSAPGVERMIEHLQSALADLERAYP